MSAFDSLTQRNQDYLLIETIKRVGVSNFSLIARMTGLNPETVRYKINKQLPKFGLQVTVNVNYAVLGFSLGLLGLKPSTAESHWFDRISYLIMMLKVTCANSFVCLCCIPYRFKRKYRDRLELLVRSKVVRSFELSDLEWVRYPSFRSEFYNFDERRWFVDWSRIDEISEETGLTSFSTNPDAKLDKIDIRILAALRADPTIGLAELGRDIGINPRTIRYHHAEHVLNGSLILGNNIRWVWPFTARRFGEIIQAFANFRDLESEELLLVRKLFNKLPFTWLEGATTGSSASRSYFAFMDIPIMYFHETMSYIETHIEQVHDKFQLSILDPAQMKGFDIPGHMYDERLGWRFFELSENTGNEISTAGRLINP